MEPYRCSVKRHKQGLVLNYTVTILTLRKRKGSWQGTGTKVGWSL